MKGTHDILLSKVKNICRIKYKGYISNQLTFEAIFSAQLLIVSISQKFKK